MDAESLRKMFTPDRMDRYGRALVFCEYTSLLCWSLCACGEFERACAG
jgi:hypothetical protein